MSCIEYTIGIAFYNSFGSVLLIEKTKLEGRWNFPGGHLEDGESPTACVVRELREECSLESFESDWNYLGYMCDREDTWKVHVLVLRELGLRMFDLKPLTGERIGLFLLSDLPERIFSNVSWLCELSINFLQPGSVDSIDHITVVYERKKRR